LYSTFVILVIDSERVTSRAVACRVIGPGETNNIRPRGSLERTKRHA